MAKMPCSCEGIRRSEDRYGYRDVAPDHAGQRPADASARAVPCPGKSIAQTRTIWKSDRSIGEFRSDEMRIPGLVALQHPLEITEYFGARDFRKSDVRARFLTLSS